MRNCWRDIPSHRPTAPEVVELLDLNPGLVSPCLDTPLAGVEMVEMERSPTPQARSQETSSQEKSAFYLPMTVETGSVEVECDCDGYCKPETIHQLQTPLVGSCVRSGHYHCP